MHTRTHTHTHTHILYVYNGLLKILTVSGYVCSTLSMLTQFLTHLTFHWRQLIYSFLIIMSLCLTIMST